MAEQNAPQNGVADTRFESPHTIYVLIDGDEGDKTVRPLRDVIRRHLEQRGLLVPPPPTRPSDATPPSPQ
jgi:hypothetical protein